MADASAASPGRFFAHSVAARETQVAVNVAGIASQWKRRRDVASPPARRAAVGATAPTTIAVHTPPALRQRTLAFDLAGVDVEAKLEHLKQQVVAEFVRVHGDTRYLKDEALTFVTGGSFEGDIQLAEQKVTRADALLAALGAGTQEVADRLTAVELSDASSRHLLDVAAANEVVLLDKLKVLEGELQRWATDSAGQAAALASMQETADAAFARSMTVASVTSKPPSSFRSTSSSRRSPR